MSKSLFLALWMSLLLPGTAAHAKGHLKAAVEAYKDQDFEKAYDLLNPLVDDYPEDLKLYLLLGHCAVKLDKWEFAQETFERALEIEPNSIAAHIQLGFIYEKLKIPEKAKESWQMVLKLAKNKRTKKLAQKHLNNLRN